MKTIVVDIDETLLISSRLSKLLSWIARQFFKLSLFTQRPNRKLVCKLQKYDEIIILTARGVNYKRFTEKQLRRHRITYDRLIMCNYTCLIYRWKLSVVEKVNPTVWIDDIKDVKVGKEGYT